MSDASGSDGMANAFQVQQAFSAMLIQIELSVLEQALAELLAAHRGQSAAIMLKEIHRETARKMNEQLATLADTFPGGATQLSQMLEFWKATRQI